MIKNEELAARVVMDGKELVYTVPYTKYQRRPKVLIVDDDIDSALQVDSIFSYLGCETSCSLRWNEGKKKMCSLKADIIILDWMLDINVDASDVIRLCSTTFAKLGWEQRSGLHHRPKIITYSSLDPSKIKLLESPFFDHLEHWEKPITQRELLARSLHLLEKIGR